MWVKCSLGHNNRRKTRQARMVAIHFTISSFNPIFSVITLLPNNKDKMCIVIDTKIKIYRFI